MDTEAGRRAEEQPGQLEAVGEFAAEEVVDQELLASPEYRRWRMNWLGDRVPCLFLDHSLRILHANESFRRLFSLPEEHPGIYLTRFYAPFFDEARSAELFRSVRSAEREWSWIGRIERTGTDQLLNVSKIWITPLGDRAPAAPRAYRAVLLDITSEHHEFLKAPFASLLKAARLKDDDTGQHIERVNRFAAALATDLLDRAEWPEVDRRFIESIGQLAALHDVGKIGTPDDILNKARPLESWERDVMQQHTINGAYILHTYPDPMAREIALRHHERWDGSGYPHGLSGTLIPLCARIVSLAEVYDALRMRRTYREPYTHEQSVRTIETERGTHFDPLLVQRFLGIADRFERTFSELADSA